MGGTGTARRFVLEAIAASKDVVTANKALLAHHGAEIFRRRRAGRRRDRLRGQRRRRHPDHPHAEGRACAATATCAVYGIVNGTSQLHPQPHERARAASSPTVLKGGAGGRPGGGRPVLRRRRHRRRPQADAAHPARLRRARAVRRASPVEGIRHVSQADIAFAREFGYVIKSLAVAKRAGERIEARGAPDHGAAHATCSPSVNGALNAIVVQGEALGSSMYLGAGAGMMPTATAVVADLMDVARNRLHGSRGRVPPLGYPLRSRRAAAAGGARRPAQRVLPALHGRRPPRRAGAHRRHSRQQRHLDRLRHPARARARRVVPIVIRTHDARETALRRAVRAIDRLAVVRGQSTAIRIEESLG